MTARDRLICGLRAKGLSYEAIQAAMPGHGFPPPTISTIRSLCHRKGVYLPKDVETLLLPRDPDRVWKEKMAGRTFG